MPTTWLTHLWNHTTDGKRSLEDPCAIIGHQLRALGHTAFWDPENDKRANIQFLVGDAGFNVMVEGFTSPVIDIIANAHAQGARFVMIATEEPGPKGFNHGVQPEMVMRQKTFPDAAKYFDAILHLVPGDPVTKWYSQFAPTAPVELGFAPSLVRPQYVPEPKYDFGFFGSLSLRREKLLRKLASYVASKFAVRIVMDFASQLERDKAMQDSKVVIQIRKFEEMGLVSSSRCNTALMNGRPVIAEPHDTALSKPWDSIVQFTKTEDEFLFVCRQARNQWRQLHGAQFYEFMKKLTPKVCVGNAIERLGLQNGPRSTKQAVAA